MKKNYAPLCIITIVLMVLPAISLTGQSRQIRQLLKKGNRYFGKENYHQAYHYYNQALLLDSSDAKALYFSGISRLLLFNNQKALDHLVKAQQANGTVDKHYNYWLGRAYHANLQFDKATEAYNRYLEEIGKNDERQESVRTLMLQAGFGKTYQANPVDYYVQPLGEGLNSPYADHSPLLTQDKRTLYFTSRRLPSGAKGKEITYRGDGWETIYTASYRDGRWSAPVPLPGEVNRKKQHTSNVQLFDNDSKMMVYKSVKYGSLFLSENRGGVWSKPEAFSQFTNTGKYEPNGFIFPKERVLYFASSRGNRDGNLDIWVVRRDQKDTTRWGDPERLPAINTGADEDAPFIADDGVTLYFCSRGHDSMGGFDVFRSTYDPFSKNWSKPVNMGYPVNSPADDIYFISDSLAKTGYVTSNREGTAGQEDIFLVRMFENVLVKGQVTIKTTNRPLPNFVLQFTSRRRLGVKGATLSTQTGAYGLQLRSGHSYSVEIRNPQGELIQTDELELPLSRDPDSEMVKNFQVDIPDTLTTLAGNRLVMKNGNLIKIKYQEQDSLMINGEVTDRAGPIYNASVRIREEDASTYLYETTSDNSGHYRFSLLPGKKTDYVIEIAKPGYLLYSAVILYNAAPNRFTTEADILSTEANQLEVRSVLTGVSTETLRVGARAVLGGVYFEFNSATLLPESSIALDKLAAFLRNNSRVAMEIGGHTDNLGPAYVNKFLSQKRAQSVVSYLVSKGIAKARLSAVGYGETDPIASNDRELNGRDINRRVEVKVLRR